MFRKKIVNPARIEQNCYELYSNARRTVHAGSYWSPIGALGAATPVTPQESLMVYNSDTSVHYIAFGASSALAAPSTPANGIPIPPGQTFIVSPGLNGFVRADSALVFGYNTPADAPVTYQNGGIPTPSI